MYQHPLNTKLLLKIYTEVRDKIYQNELSQADIDKLRTELDTKQGEEKYKYSLVLIAMYEKLGQNKQALGVIKQIKKEGKRNKELNEIEQRLKGSKRRIFDLKSWDNLIQWRIADIQDEEITQEVQGQEVLEQKQQKLEEENILENSENPSVKKEENSVEIQNSIPPKNNVVKEKDIEETKSEVLVVNNGKRKEIKISNKAYFDGLKEYRAGNLKRAIQYLEESLEQEDDYMAVFMLGKCYAHIHIKEREKAEKLFIRVIELDKLNIPARIELGRLYASQGKIEKAEQLYIEAIALDAQKEIQEQNVQIRMELGRLYASQGKSKKAEQMYKEIIELRKKKTVFEVQEEKIYQVLPIEVLDVIQRIEQKYHMKMNDVNTSNKYTKKFNNLKLLLEKGNSNKRAKAEIMLIMINEGFRQVVKSNYPTEYEFIERLIQAYKDKKIDARDVKEKLDEYCM